MTLRPFGIGPLDDVLSEAIGRGHRRDPVAARTGGPAGNARLTAWVGLLLLLVIVGELVTLLDVTGLIGWHIGIGIAMTALALLKSGSTGWRIMRYYLGNPRYVAAGPPPIVLRTLGPLVIGSTLGVLGSGFALMAIGQRQSETPWFSVLGQRISPVTVHQVLFILFAVFTGLHLLARFVPALRLAGRGPQHGAAPYRVPGELPRGAAVLAAVVASALAIVLLVPAAGDWHPGEHHRHAARP